MAHPSHIFLRASEPKPRKGIYSLYWSFASERHAAFDRRLAGKPWPWTDDRILQTFKFCNVYRAADRVSQYMIANVCYAQDTGDDQDRIFQIVAFRIFSNIATWEGIRSVLGRIPQLPDLISGEFERAVELVKSQNGKLYTGAFILCANKAFGFDEKFRNHVALFKKMFIHENLGKRIMAVKSFREMIDALQSFPLIGKFMAYQIAIDLNYSDLISFSENEYTQAGPGALRGLKKAFTDLGDYSSSDTILWMVDRQQIEFERLGLPFNGLFGRPLHAIDCQGLFCELDKYCREAAPELISDRSRIKAKFFASSSPLTLFFPPKWRLTPYVAVVPGGKDHRTVQGDLSGVASRLCSNRAA
jgi:hypothetical protein